MNAPDTVKAWLASFPYEAAKAEQAKLQTQMNDIGAQLYQLQEAIQLYERHNPKASPATPREVAVEPVLTSNRPSLREAIKSVLSEDAARQWTTEALREVLVNRGLLRGDSQGKNNLFAMLSMMAKSGQVVRVKTGVYRIPFETDLPIPGFDVS